MYSIEKFKIRKLEELSILNGYLNNKIELSNCNTEKDIFECKNSIIKHLRNDNREKFYHHLTNNDQTSFQNEIFNYNYTYERFNGFLKIENFANKFYNLSNEIFSETYFTNCGMTAIVSLLTSMCLMCDVSIDLLYEETYFETIKYLSIVNKKNAKYKALYIDTIASDFSFEIKKELLCNYDYIIIDTTCFLSNEFSNIIKFIIEEHIPCILVRSHTKLDLVGTEYSHMGTVSFIKPKNLEKHIEENFENIDSNCKHLIGVYGACLIPENFPSFFFDDRLNLLNKQRIDTISDNTVTFCNILKRNNIDYQLPNHKQFCLIYLGKKDIKLEDLKSKIISFCNELNSNGYNIYHAVSFGFDYIAIDCYQNFIDETFKIRVCLPDETTQNIIQFSEKFLEYLKKENLIQM